MSVMIMNGARCYPVGYEEYIQYNYIYLRASDKFRHLTTTHGNADGDHTSTFWYIPAHNVLMVML
jgi:hypothetical protein